MTIKQCSIGNDCRVGMKSKLNNCILIGKVEIGERYEPTQFLLLLFFFFFFFSYDIHSCTIQNCVLGEGTIIGNNCNLNDCFTGKGVRVADNSRLKSETLNSDDGTKDHDNELEGEEEDNYNDTHGYVDEEDDK